MKQKRAPSQSVLKLAQAAMTNYCSLEGLDNTLFLLLKVLEAEESTIKMLNDLVPSKNCLLIVS